MADTIALMRKRVLDMAIRGELVEQRREEETAEAIIEEIKIEKKRLTKSSNISIVPDKDKPFDLPKNWKWINFGDLVHFKIGKTPARGNTAFWDKGIYPWVSIADMNNDRLLNTTKEIISEEAKNIAFKGSISPRGTLIMSFKLTIGKLAILDMDAFHNEAIISIYPNHSESDTVRDYLYYIINALDLLRDTKAAIKGATLNKTSLNEILVPLPPLAEQKRIVSKIEEIFAVIDQIGSKKEEALSIIRNIRQTALQDAIRGVLVEQEENDEPASVLYEKIQAEKEQLVIEKKIKKEKPLLEIDKNEIPFEIPKNWRWTRLGDLGFFKKGPFGSALTKSIFVEDSLESIKVYEQKNAIQSDCTLGEYFITKDYYEEKMASNTVIPGDIIVSCAGTIGKSYIIPDGARLGIINQALMRIRVYTINKQYFRLIFNHVIHTDGAQGKGSAIKNIPPMKVLNNLLVPLPPLAEQERIVEKIDEIMAICDQMEAIFDGSSEVKENFKVV